MEQFQIVIAVGTVALSVFAFVFAARTSIKVTAWQALVVMDVGWAFGSVLIWLWWLLDFTGIVPPAPESLGIAAHLLWAINLINIIGRAWLVRGRNAGT